MKKEHKKYFNTYTTNGVLFCKTIQMENQNNMMNNYDNKIIMNNYDNKIIVS